MTIEETWKDETFEASLRSNIVNIREDVVHNQEIRSNPYRTLYNKGLLTVNGIKEQFALENLVRKF